MTPFIKSVNRNQFKLCKEILTEVPSKKQTQGTWTLGLFYLEKSWISNNHFHIWIENGNKTTQGSVNFLWLRTKFKFSIEFSKKLVSITVERHLLYKFVNQIYCINLTLIEIIKQELYWGDHFLFWKINIYYSVYVYGWKIDRNWATATHYPFTK